ncbi:MAG: hypothetical protein OEZ03_15220, partial [Alphaproteobacteria bacterium]|nr:hypothetical protein [Alphaproteobacteria bacterium]
MSPTTPDLATASQRDNAIGQLEQVLLARPNNLRAAKQLLQLLEAHQPSVLVSGRYTDCQRGLSQAFKKDGWVDELYTPKALVEHYRAWQELLDAREVTQNLPVTQLFTGQLLTIKGEYGNCGARLEMFKQHSVISRLCHDCYKVQILPVDLIGLMQVYFVLRKLDLPN